MNIHGCLDQVTPSLVVGWATDADLPDAPVTVEVWMDGAVAGTALATIYRPDLKNAGIGSGCYGFRIDLPGAGSEIVVRAAGLALVPPAPLNVTDDKANRAGEFWDTCGEWRPKMAARVRWNESPRIVADHNQRVCGRAVGSGINAGLVQLLREKAGASLPFGRAVSVGCGTGAKEMLLLKDEVARSFDLFDVSATSLKEGKRIAEEWCLTEKVRFIHGRDYREMLGTDYDMVYWDNALHHMFDAREAVKWSRDVLRPGGWFVMTDFVGANRFQYPDEAIALANLVRSSMPASFLTNPADPDTPYPGHVRRPTLEEMEYDPSEAADSEAIIPAIKEFFPDALIRHVGGTVYHLAVSDVLTHIAEDSNLLGFLLNLDRNTSHIPHYAVALAQAVDLHKQPETTQVLK